MESLRIDPLPCGVPAAHGRARVKRAFCRRCRTLSGAPGGKGFPPWGGGPFVKMCVAARVRISPQSTSPRQARMSGRQSASLSIPARGAGPRYLVFLWKSHPLVPRSRPTGPRGVPELTVRPTPQGRRKHTATRTRVTLGSGFVLGGRAEPDAGLARLGRAA